MLLNTLPEDKLSAEVLAAVQSVMKQLSSDNFQDGACSMAFLLWEQSAASAPYRSVDIIERRVQSKFRT
jgi:hypothetical protein